MNIFVITFTQPGVETQPFERTLKFKPFAQYDLVQIDSVTTNLPDGVNFTISENETRLTLSGVPVLGSAGFYTNTLTRFYTNTSTGETIGDIVRFRFTINVVCLAANSLILMADGTHKEIQFIQRGDIVSSDLNCNHFNTVARLNIQNLKPKSKIDIVQFDSHSITHNQPFQTLLATANHPIIYQDKKDLLNVSPNLHESQIIMILVPKIFCQKIRTTNIVFMTYNLKMMVLM